MPNVSERIGSALSQNGYEQIKTVGEGSFGKAILVRPVASSARADCNRKDAIIKMVDLSRATKKEKEDALRESHVLSSLKHPNVVQYRNNFLAEGWLCIVMDYCEGGDLSGRIKKTRVQRKTFSEDQVLWWFAQGMESLKYIHDLHILHRDLKSGNFFLSRSGNLKMGDFGIAKVLECTAALAQTQVGTPYYLCPEICKGKPYSWGSDIWAMGCILHEMCALKVPFDGHDLKSLIQRITKGPIPDLPSMYSSGLQDLLNKLLNRNASSRPEADEILEMPVLSDTIKKLHKGLQVHSEEAASEVNSARPQSVVSSAVSSGQYSEFAGTFSKRDKVEYHSATHCEWLPATVTAVNATGEILMDVKPNTWLSIDMQAEKVRPRQNADASDAPKVKQQPSNVSAPKNSGAQGGAARAPLERRRSTPGMVQRPSARPPPPEIAARPQPKPGGQGVRRPSSGGEVAAGGKFRPSPRAVAAARLGA